MPQDIPVEASELLDFTPDSLKDIERAPVFVLRASTSREKRYHRRLLLEQGIRYHDREDVRAEVLNGLKELWDADAFAEHGPIIKALWTARDDFEQQDADAIKKGEPRLVWSYDPEIETAVDELVRKVSQEWRPLRSMIADNADYGSMAAPLLVVVTLKRFTGLDVRLRTERGYFTIETVEAIEEALSKFERDNGLIEGTAWAELTVACSRRMYLSEEERGNSESQSPSTTAPETSNEKATSEKAGKSPASGRSRKIPAAA